MNLLVPKLEESQKTVIRKNLKTQEVKNYLPRKCFDDCDSSVKKALTCLVSLYSVPSPALGPLYIMLRTIL